jgi:hypothetical protein
MSGRLPPDARRVLENGTLCHVAAATPSGPHMTPVVFVLDGDALWITTARSSVKARAIRRDASVAGLVRAGGLAVGFRGRARTYDTLDPLSWPAAAASGPRLARAATRFTLKNARFFAGYAADAHRVPLAWTPPGRVFVRISLDAGFAADPVLGGEIRSRWGSWPEGSSVMAASFTALGPARSLDLRAPSDVRRRVGAGGEGALALASADGLVALPVTWRRAAREGAYEARVPIGLADLAGLRPADTVAMVVDHLAVWRAAEMTGMMLRGRAEVFAPGRTRRGVTALAERAGPGEALVRVRPEAVVWWRGWSSGTVRAPAARGARRRSMSRAGRDAR